jgi:hypothetical protein
MIGATAWPLARFAILWRILNIGRLPQHTFINVNRQAAPENRRT